MMENLILIFIDEKSIKVLLFQVFSDFSEKFFKKSYELHKIQGYGPIGSVDLIGRIG